MALSANTLEVQAKHARLMSVRHAFDSPIRVWAAPCRRTASSQIQQREYANLRAHQTDRCRAAPRRRLYGLLSRGAIAAVATRRGSRGSGRRQRPPPDGTGATAAASGSCAQAPVEPAARHEGRSSFRRRVSFTALGSALPAVAFMTWPTKKPSSLVLPAR